MLQALRWLGLDWDEGPDVGGPHAPYRQSERLAIYHKFAERLIAGGYARRSPAEPGVVRLLTPQSGSITFTDVVRGPVAFDSRKIARDPVLIRSDGYPTYHLAAVVDDHLMGVTHILRGEEWISSTPLHLLTFKALGGPAPVFAHLPLVTDREGKKLKKRDPAFVARSYQAAGYFPPAMMNYLALLGWHPGTQQELFTPDELISLFRIERLSRSPAAFDPDRLRWFSQQHLARLSTSRLTDQAKPFLQAVYPESAGWETERLEQLIAAVREEMALLGDVVPATRFAFRYDLTDEAREVLHSEPADPALHALREALLSQADASPAEIAGWLKTLRDRFKKSRGWGGREVMFPLRAALTGNLSGPHLSDVIAVLGREESLRRIDFALGIMKP